MTKKIIKKIIYFIFILLFGTYVLFQVVGANFAMIKTENASKMSVYDGVDADGIIIRNEKYIKNTSSGYISYVLEDCGTVSAGGCVAEIFENESDAAAVKEAARLTEEINELKKLNKAAENPSIQLHTVNEQLYMKLIESKKSILSSSFSAAASDRAGLQYLLNETQVINGTVKSFNERISVLTTQRDSIKNSGKKSIASIRADTAGSFVQSTDGYEMSYDFLKVLSMSVEDFKKKPEKKQVPDGTIGRVISGVSWYIVCTVTAEEAIILDQGGKKVDVGLQLASGRTIPAEIKAVNQHTKKSEGLVVLECTDMNLELAMMRNVQIKIISKTYTGIRVSKKALHDDYVSYNEYDNEGNKTEVKKKVQGIYMQYGNELRFKQVVIIYSDNDFVICDPDPDREARNDPDSESVDFKLLNGETVELYDKVVVGGVDLYDGKVVK